MLQNGVLNMSRLKIQMALGVFLPHRMNHGILLQMVVGTLTLVIPSLIIIGEVLHFQMEAGGLTLALQMADGMTHWQMSVDGTQKT